MNLSESIFGASPEVRGRTIIRELQLSVFTTEENKRPQANYYEIVIATGPLHRAT